MPPSPLNYKVLCASGEPAAPLLVPIPHSSTVVPADVRQSLLLDNIELEKELLLMTDWYTDQLFNHALEVEGMMFVNRLSRFVIDPERFPNDTDEMMASRGMGQFIRRLQMAVPCEGRAWVPTAKPF